MIKKKKKLLLSLAAILLTTFLVFETQRESPHEGASLANQSRLLVLQQPLTNPALALSKTSKDIQRNQNGSENWKNLSWLDQLSATAPLDAATVKKIENLARDLFRESSITDIIHLLTESTAVNLAATSYLIEEICGKFASVGKNEFFNFLNHAPPQLLEKMHGFEAPGEVFAQKYELGEVMEQADLVPDKVKQVVKDDVIRVWSLHDPDSVGNWLNQQTNYPGRDQLIDVFIDAVTDLDPEAARKWADAIEHRGIRQDALDALSRIKQMRQ